MNQTAPSPATTTSLGLLNRLPSQRSATTVTEPSSSVRVTRRFPCSHETRRPCRSRVWPFVYPAGERKTLTDPSVSSQRMIRSFGMSLNSRYFPEGTYTGPSVHRPPENRHSR